MSNWPDKCDYCGGNGWTACPEGSYANCPGAQELRNCGVKVEQYMEEESLRRIHEYAEELRARGHHAAAESLEHRSIWERLRDRLSGITKLLRGTP